MRTIKLGEYGSFRNGLNFSKEESKGQGCKILGVGDFENKTYIPIDSLGEINVDLVTDDDTIQDGDIIFVRSNGNKSLVGRMLLAKRIKERICYSGFCIRFRPHNRDNSLKLFYSLKSPYCKRQYTPSQQTNITNLSQDKLSEVLIPDFLITSAQNKVVNLLSNLDEMIDLNQRLCAELEAMAKALYDYWFVQFDFPDENGKPYRTSGGAMELCQKLGHKVPKGWKVGTLQDLLSIEKDGFDPQTYGDSIVEHYSIPAYDDSHYPMFESASSIMSGKYRVPEKAILFSKLNPQFKRIWDPPCLSELRACSTEFMVYLPRDVANRPYVFSVLNSDSFYRFTVQIASSSTGSRKRLDPDATLKYDIVLPPDTIVNQYCAQVGAMVERMKQLHIENHNLTCLRDWLLPMLMNGQAHVKKGGE